MFRLLTSVSAIALLISVLPASAAPRPDEKPGGPAVIGQAKSFNELLEMAKTLVKNVGGDAIYKEFEREVLPDLDPKKLPGVDPKRRFGLYGFINPKLEDCRGVLMIPVPSEKDFVDQLAAFHIEVAKGKEPGVSDIVTPPDFPIPVSFRVYKEYAYVSIGGSDVLADKVILDPRDVINEKEKAAGYLSIRFDRITPEAKKSMLAIIRDQIEHLKEMIPEPDLKDAFHSAEKLANRWLKILFDEGKEIAIRIDADTKTGDLYADITVEAMPKTALAEAFATRKPNINAFASLAGDDYVQRVFVTAPLFADEAKEGWSKLIDFGTKEIIKDVGRGNAPPEVPALIDAVSKSLKATIETGEMDLAAAIRGPNKDGFYTAVGAVHCRETAQLEKAIRDVVKVLPERERSYFKFDAGKIGDLAVHEIDLSSEAADVALKVFGKGQKAYFAFGKTAIYASYGPDGMKLLKEAIEAKPGPAAAFDSGGNGKKTVELMKKLFPDDDPNGPRVNLGWIETMTGAMRVSVEGGDKLKIRVSNNVGMMMYFMLGRSAGAAAQRVPPPVAK